MPRRAAKEYEVIEVLLAQGAILPCKMCRVAIKPGGYHRDHYEPLANGGEDEPENWQYLCLDCHEKKTNGKPHTSYGSDKHAIAKVKRLRGETGQNKRKAKIPARPFPSKEQRRAAKQKQQERRT